LAIDSTKRSAAEVPPTRPVFNWFDVVWLVFLAGLAALPPVDEIHKQFTLLAIGGVQVFEGTIIGKMPKRGRIYIVILKILLATLLIAHTTGNDPAINSPYYLIYYISILTAAVYFEFWGTLFWTAVASAAYCSYLYQAYVEGYEINPDNVSELLFRVLFFFILAVLVNRLVSQYRKQTLRYQEAAEALADTNKQLITAQEEAQRSQRLAALGQMSAGLAHEIRNPLGVIKGSAEMLQQKLGDGNPLASELASYISGEVNRLSSFVTRFLDFARPQQLTLDHEKVTDVLDAALARVVDRYPEARVRITREYDAALAPIELDEEMCQSAFVNIIQNAYEAMGESGGELRVTAHAATREMQRGVEIKICDSGPGIPVQLREEVFNPFVTMKKEGTGLGLSIVSKVIDEHHGSIRIEDAPGGGACFVIFMPAQQPAIPLALPPAS
jgi:two-component system, NtrC family, sensor histidine kinase HydH